MNEPQVAFAVRQKQPKTISEAITAALQVHSFLPSPTARQPEHSEVIAAVRSTQDTMLEMMQKLASRMDKLETDLTKRQSSPRVTSERPGRTEKSTLREPRPPVFPPMRKRRPLRSGVCCTSPKQNAGKLLTLRANGQAQESEIGEASIPIFVYSLSGMVFHHPTSFILDTGAAVTLLRKDTWDHARPRAAELDTWKLISVDGSPLHIHGHAGVKINLGDMEFSHHVVIAEDLSSEGILGLDFLEVQGCTINTRHRTVTFEDTGETLELNCAKTTQKKQFLPCLSH